MEPFPSTHRAELASRLPPRAARDLVEWQDGESPSEMMTRVLEGERKVDDLVAKDPAEPAISDERPINEYFLLRTIRR